MSAGDLTPAPPVAFDELARHYDAQFTATALGSELRRMSWAHFDRVFEGREYLLDVGCGTGEDAIHLARRGHRVVATDPSRQMVRLASHKAARAGCADSIRFVCAPLERLPAELAGEKFDGVYSNFGAMNCAADLPEVARELVQLLRTHAPLVWVVMGRYVPWEWAWYLARGDAGTAFRRLRRGGVGWRGITVNYPTPAALERALRPHFAGRGVAPLGFALPGSYAAPWLERSPRLLAALVRAEGVLHRLPVLAACADHYVFEARSEAE